jgi:hypothetical protein
MKKTGLEDDWMRGRWTSLGCEGWVSVKGVWMDRRVAHGVVERLPRAALVVRCQDGECHSNRTQTGGWSRMRLCLTSPDCPVDLAWRDGGRPFGNGATGMPVITQSSGISAGVGGKLRPMTTPREGRGGGRGSYTMHVYLTTDKQPGTPLQTTQRDNMQVQYNV